MSPEIGFSLISITIALYSLYRAYQAGKAVKVQSLFSGFQQANQATIEHPFFLKDVHGLEGLSEEEYKNIAYLSVLMDAFQHEDYEHKKTTFLDNIIAVPENKERWIIMKNIYYGEAHFDKKFKDYIDKKFKIK